MKIVEELKKLEWANLDNGCTSLSTLYTLKEHTVEEKKQICKLIEAKDIKGLTTLLEEDLYDFDECVVEESEHKKSVFAPQLKFGDTIQIKADRDNQKYKFIGKAKNSNTFTFRGEDDQLVTIEPEEELILLSEASNEPITESTNILSTVEDKEGKKWSVIQDKDNTYSIIDPDTGEEEEIGLSSLDDAIRVAKSMKSADSIEESFKDEVASIDVPAPDFAKDEITGPIEYKGYGIDYNIYGQGEYSVQVDGDDMFFSSIEDAEDFIDTLEPMEECFSNDAKLNDANVEEDLQHDEIIKQGEIKVAGKMKKEQDEFEKLKASLPIKECLKECNMNLEEEFGEDAPGVLRILEDIDSFVRSFDDNYEDEVGDLDGVEYAHYNLINKGPHGLRADLDQMTQDVREMDPDCDDYRYWCKHYADRYNSICDELDHFYDNPNTPMGLEDDSDRDARIADYRKYAGIDEDFEINESNINDDALTKVACLNYRSKDDIKAELLSQD